MTLSQYLRVARANWLLIAALTALGALGAAAYAWAQTPMYSASAQMFVSTTGNDSDIATITQGSTLAQQRVKSYAAIITAPDVLDPVIKQLKLPYANATELSGHVTASSPLDTVLLDVKVTDTVPERARDTANAVAAQFTDYVGRLELPSGKGTSPVKVTVTAPAVAAGAPDSPKKMLDLALGLLVGLGLGIGLAVLRDSLDRTIGAHHDPGELTGSPVLAGVSDDPSVKDAPLIVHDPFAARAEAFRQLRTNIRYLSVDQEVRSLVVTSSVAGEGKTTTAANLAIAMAQGGENVVLIDADLRRPSIAELFGLPGGVGLTTVLVGDVPVEDAVQTWRDDLNLSVLTSGPLPPNPSELIGSHRMAELITQLTSVGFMVVVDSPPLLPVTDAAVLGRLTGGALVVTRIGSTRIEQLGAAVEALRTAGATVLGVVANRLPRRRGAGSYAYRYGYGSDETYAPATSSTGQVTSSRPAPPAPKGKKRSRKGSAAGRTSGRSTPALPVEPAPAPARVESLSAAPSPFTAAPTPPAPTPPAPTPPVPTTTAPVPAPVAAALSVPAAPAPAAPLAAVPVQPLAAPPVAAPSMPPVPSPAAPTAGRSVAEMLSPTGAEAPRAVNVLASKAPRLFSRSKRSEAPPAPVQVTPPPIGPPQQAPVTSPTPSMPVTSAAPPMVSAVPTFESTAAVEPAASGSPSVIPAQGASPAADLEPSFDTLVEAEAHEEFPYAPPPASDHDSYSATRSAPSSTSEPYSTSAPHSTSEPYSTSEPDSDSGDLYTSTSVYAVEAVATVPVPEPTPAAATPWAQHAHWVQTDAEVEAEPATYVVQQPVTPPMAMPPVAPPLTPVASALSADEDEEDDEHQVPEPPVLRQPPAPEPPYDPNPMFTPRPVPAAPEPPRPPSARRPAPELPPIWSPKPTEPAARPGTLPLTSASTSPSSVSAATFEGSASSIVMPAGDHGLGVKRGAPLASVSTMTAPPSTVLDIEAAHELDAANAAAGSTGPGHASEQAVGEILLPQQEHGDRLDSWYAQTWPLDTEVSTPVTSTQVTSTQVTALDAAAAELPALADQVAPEAVDHQADSPAWQGFLSPRSHRGAEPRTAEDRAVEMRAAAMREAAARLAAQRQAQREAQLEAQEQVQQETWAATHAGWPVEQRSTSVSGSGEGWPFSSPSVPAPSSPSDWAPEPWPGPDSTPAPAAGLEDLLGEPHPPRPTRRDGGGWRPSRRR